MKNKWFATKNMKKYIKWRQPEKMGLENICMLEFQIISFSSFQNVLLEEIFLHGSRPQKTLKC